MGISLNPSAILNGQGIDVSSLVQQAMSASSGQLTGWQNEEATLQTQASDIGVISNDLTALQNAVNALSDPLGAMTAQAATSSNTSVLTATATTSATAGNHTVVVNSLASTGSIYTAAVAGGADASFLPAGVTGGDIQLTIGGSGGKTADFAITPGVNDTLNTLETYIKQQSAAQGWGISATVVTDASGARLAISGSQTGTPGALAITSNQVTGTLNTTAMQSADTSILASDQTTGDITLQIGGANGTTVDLQITQGSNDTLSTLASYINGQSEANGWGLTANVVKDSNGYHLSVSSQGQGAAGAVTMSSNTNTTLTAAANASTNLTFEPPVGGTNAAVTIDGIPYSESSNSFSVATIPGVTINLASAAPGETLQLNVGANTAQATSAINNFVSAYNRVINDINQEFQVNGSNRQGPLGSDTALRSLQSSLMNDVTYAVAGTGGMVNLGSFGINMNDDGTLTVGTAPNGQSLSQILASNPASVQSFFQNTSSTGFANNFHTDLNNLADPTIGVLSVDLAQNKAAQHDLQTTISNFQTQLSAQQTALTAEFDQVNASLQQYPLLLQQVTQTLATMDMNNSNSGSSTPTLTSGL